MADLVSDLGLEQLFYLNLGEPFLSPNIGPELSLLRQKNPKCRNRHFDQQHCAQHGRQTRGGPETPAIFISP